MPLGQCEALESGSPDAIIADNKVPETELNTVAEQRSLASHALPIMGYIPCSAGISKAFGLFSMEVLINSGSTDLLSEKVQIKA